MSSRVFICYARADQGFVLPFAEQLKARGIGVFVDQWDIPAEQDWDRSIDRALRECARLLIVLSPASVDSREVRGELRTALDLGKPVLPVLYQPCEMPRQLRLVQFVDFTGKPASDAAGLSRVMRALAPSAESDVLQPEPTPAPPVPPRPARSMPRWSLGALSARTKAAIGAAVLLGLAGLAWFGLDMATEARRRLNDVALSPDGAWLATATGQGIGVRGAVRVWDVNSGREAAFLPIEGPVWVCAWSPDGKRLAVGDHTGTIRLYETGNWQQRGTLSGSRDMIRFIEWAPDSTAIATGDSSGSLWVWDVPGSTLRFSKPVQSNRLDVVAWSHDGTLIAVGGAEHWVGLVTARDGTMAKRLDGPTSVVASVAFSPDDERVAASSFEAPYVMVWDKSGARTDLQGHRAQVERVAWSPDGRYLASGGKDDLVHLWNAKLELVRRITLSGQYDSGTGLAWATDGTRLAVGDAATIRIFNPESDAPVQTFTERSEGAFDSVEIAGWSGDGTRLGTFNTSDRLSSVWDVPRATRLQTFSLGLWRSLTE